MVKNTVTEAVEDLEKASNGEEIRQALIDLLDTMNTIGGDTELLAGHDQTYYVLEKELQQFEKEINMWLQYDEIPTKDSLNVMRNKDITKYFGDVLENLKKINGDTKGDYDKAPESEIGTDIQSALNALSNTISQIKTEIGNKGVEVKDTDSVMDLAERINDIKMTTVEVVPYTATKNGEEVKEKIDPETHKVIKAYTPVTVKLELKGYSDKLTKNGQHTVPEGYDGWENVTIEVDNSGSSSSGSGGSSGGSSSKKKGKISDDVVYNTGGADIRSNTTVRAEDYGLDAYDSATVNVTDYEMEDKTFQVTFMSEGEQLGEPVEVQMGHSCGYEGETPTYSGGDDPSEFWYFKGWNPEPVSVVSDMTCEAEFDVWYPNSGTPIKSNLNYINATWSDIINGNAHPDYGDIKLLRLTNGAIYRMRKVNNSDDAARSVWMSMEGMSGLPYPYTLAHQNEATVWSWADENNQLRTYFNETLLPLIPEPVRSHIVPMNKYSISATQLGNTWVFNHMRSTDSIWLPGLYEMNYLSKKDRGDDEARNFHNSILTPVTNDYYQGESYKNFFQWLGDSQPLKDQLKTGYNSYRGSSIPDGTIMVRNYRNGDRGFPHCKIPVTIPQHTDPVTGETVPEKTYNDWDSLDLTTKCDFYSGCEPRFDNWLVEHAERGSKYIPWFCENREYHGANVLLYEFVAGTFLTRDVIPRNARYGSIDENNKPEFAGINEFCIPTAVSSWDYTHTGQFCFGLG